MNRKPKHCFTFWLFAATLLLTGCSKPAPHAAAAESPSPQSDCASQARQFEADWHREFDWMRTKGAVLKFSSHYNARLNHCYVRVQHGNGDWVKDADKGVDSPAVAGRILPGDAADLARIRALMEDTVPTK